MKWMDSYLEGGDISGKILCPNPRCKAKVGNFAWTGMHCSCHDWVVPVCL
jgi:dual specificity phosphatase 12